MSDIRTTAARCEMSMWYASSVKSQGRPGDQVGDRGPCRRHDLAPGGDLGTKVGGQLAMQVSNQRLGAGDAHLFVVCRQLLEGRDGRAGAVMREDHLEAPVAGSRHD